MATDKKLTLDLKLDDVDKNLFTNEELHELETQARADLKKEEKAKRHKLLLEKAKQAVRVEVDPTEEVIPHMINLPPFSKGITIDNMVFIHGEEYKFTRRKLSTIREIESNAWKHEDVTHGHFDPNFGRSARNPRLSARGR